MSILFRQFGNANDFWYSILGRKSSSGEKVNEKTALSLSSYFACLRVISEDISGLPLPLYHRNGSITEKAVDHPVYNFLTMSMSPVLPNIAMRGSITMHAISWGNGYAEIIFDNSGRPKEFILIHPSRVSAKKMDDGSIVYLVRNDDGKYMPIDQKNMFHIRGMGDGLFGISVLNHANDSIGLGLAAQRYGGSFFANDGTPGIAILHPGKLGEKAASNMRESWKTMHQGAGNAKRPFVAEEGIKLETFGIPPNEAQFLETRQFQIEEISRWFRLAPVKIQHNQNVPFANIEALNHAHVNEALMIWLLRWEEEISRKLLLPSERTTYFARHNVNALLRGDMAARANFYRTLISTGVMSPDEARAKEDMNPIPGGDSYFMQQAMTTLERIAEGENLKASSNENPTDDADRGKSDSLGD